MPRKKHIKSFSISDENIDFLDKTEPTLRSKLVDRLITEERLKHGKKRKKKVTAAKD